MTTAPPMNAERVCSGICILRQRLVYFSVVAIIYISPYCVPQAFSGIACIPQ